MPSDGRTIMIFLHAVSEKEANACKLNNKVKEKTGLYQPKQQFIEHFTRKYLQLTAANRVLLQKLTVAHLLKIFLASYETRMFNMVFMEQNLS
jgi:hypothetical protein